MPSPPWGVTWLVFTFRVSGVTGSSCLSLTGARWGRRVALSGGRRVHICCNETGLRVPL